MWIENNHGIIKILEFSFISAFVEHIFGTFFGRILLLYASHVHILRVLFDLDFRDVFRKQNITGLQYHNVVILYYILCD